MGILWTIKFPSKTKGRTDEVSYRGSWRNLLPMSLIIMTNDDYCSKWFLDIK